MPIAESSPAARLAFDAAVFRVRERRVSDLPYPRAPAPATAADSAGDDDAVSEPATQPSRSADSRFRGDDGGCPENP